jgi:hypothetical protein
MVGAIVFGCRAGIGLPAIARWFSWALTYRPMRGTHKPRGRVERSLQAIAVVNAYDDRASMTSILYRRNENGPNEIFGQAFQNLTE